jgi:hypothetical protein
MTTLSKQSKFGHLLVTRTGEKVEDSSWFASLRALKMER